MLRASAHGDASAMTHSPDRRIVSAKRAPLRAAAATAALCTIWSMLPACSVQTPGHAGDGAQQPTQGSPVTQTLRIEQHFSGPELELAQAAAAGEAAQVAHLVDKNHADPNAISPGGLPLIRSEAHTSELQSLMRIS